MSDTCVWMFGSQPSTKHRSPLAKNDHPKLDTSNLLDKDGIAQCQSLIGILQWTITLGRFNVGTAVMTMSGFRVAPQEGHMKRLRRICGYLARFSDGCIRIWMEKPDYSGLLEYNQDWARLVYGNAKEALPKNCPEPRGKSVCTRTYKDANLCHDVSAGRAVTGVSHFINKMPIDWHSRKQSTVETETHMVRSSVQRRRRSNKYRV
jgi:hypothetical protein